MQEVSLSDQLYRQAERLAKAQGRTTEAFVAEAVRLYLAEGGETLSLTPEQVDLVREAQAEIRAGKGLTLEAVRSELAVDRDEWLKANQS